MKLKNGTYKITVKDGEIVSMAVNRALDSEEIRWFYDNFKKPEMFINVTK